MDQNLYKAPGDGPLAEREKPLKKDLKAAMDLVEAAATWISWVVFALVVIVAIVSRCLPG